MQASIATEPAQPRRLCCAACTTCRRASRRNRLNPEDCAVRPAPHAGEHRDGTGSTPKTVLCDLHHMQASITTEPAQPRRLCCATCTTCRRASRRNQLNPEDCAV